MDTPAETNSRPAVSPEEAKKERKRARANTWYQEHRDQVLDRRRAEYKARLQYVTDEAGRAEFRADPGKALREKDVVCLECWQIVPEMLNNAHLKPHGLTPTAYKAIEVHPGIPRYSKGTGLVSRELAAKLSALHRGDASALAQRGREALKEFQGVGRSQGGLKSFAARRAASSRMRGIARPDLTGVPSFEIVSRWLIDNKTTDEIERETCLTKRALHKRLRRIFGVHPRFADRWSNPAPMPRVHGEIMSDAWLGRLLEHFGGIYKSQLARAMGLPDSRLYSISRRRKNLALIHRSAERLIGQEREMLAILFRDRGNQAQNFRAVVPDLPQRLEAAREAIAVLRGFVGHARDHKRELDATVEGLCAESQLAVARDELQSQASRILLWMPKILSWLGKNGGRQLGRNPSALALKFVADDYHTKSWVIQRALNTGGQPRDLNVIHSIILTNFRSQPAKRPKGKRGREKSDDVKERIRAIAAFELVAEKEGRFTRQRDFAPYIYPDKPASAYDALRAFKSENKDRIQAAKSRMTRQKAESIVANLQKPLQLT